MSWKQPITMSPRREFVTLASQPETHVGVLCRRYGISRKTGYGDEAVRGGGPHGPCVGVLRAWAVSRRASSAGRAGRRGEHKLRSHPQG